MLAKRSLVSIVSMVMIVLGAGVASGQNYPNKTVRIFTGPAGGGNDASARLIAQGISGPLGQPVIVENRGSTVIASAAVANSPPDGYNVLFAGDLVWLGQLLRDIQYDPLREYSPVSITGTSPLLLIVHPSLPVKSVKELIALAKARPGELNYASATTGGIDHIAGELFKSMTGIKMVRVSYKGGNAALTGLMGGEGQLQFVNITTVAPQLKTGKVRVLAVTSAQPSSLAVGLPTMAAAGLPGFEITGTDAVYAPAKTPAVVVNRLNQEIVRFLRTPEGKEKYLSFGAEVVASSPEEHAAMLKSRITVIGKLIKDAGIKID